MGRKKKRDDGRGLERSEEADRHVSIETSEAFYHPLDDGLAVKDFPQDPLKRSALYWKYLLGGVWRHFPTRRQMALEMTLKREGLDWFKHVVLFDGCPSDELLERSKRFNESLITPVLRRGKGSRSFSPFWLHFHYELLLSYLEKLPRKSRNPKHRRMLLDEKLNKFYKDHPHFRAISDEKLRVLCNHKTAKKLTLEVMAELYGQTPGSIDKILDQYRKPPKYPRTISSLYLEDPLIVKDRFKDEVDESYLHFFYPLF